MSAEVSSRPKDYVLKPQFSQGQAAISRNVADLLTHEDLHAAAEKKCPISRSENRKNGEKNQEREIWIQSRVDGVRSLVAATPKYDAIGITWDRNEYADFLRLGFDQTQVYQRGFKGYRIDVLVMQPGASAGTWNSLCGVSRNFLSPVLRRALQCSDGSAFGEGTCGKVTCYCPCRPIRLSPKGHQNLRSRCPKISFSGRAQASCTLTRSIS